MAAIKFAPKITVKLTEAAIPKCSSEAEVNLAMQEGSEKSLAQGYYRDLKSDEKAAAEGKRCWAKSL